MRNAARTLATLHALDPAAIGLADEPVVGPDAEIDRWCRLLETIDPVLGPGLARRGRRAAGNASRRRCRPAVVHGDFRLGNLLAVGPDVTAVVDWEIWTRRRSARRRRLVPRQRRPGDLPATDSVRGQHCRHRRSCSTVYAGALGRDVADVAWFRALACFKSTATWSLIVKHNRRRADPDPDVEAMAPVLPHLLAAGDEMQ